MTSTDALVRGVRSGDRRALARAITLVESTREDHREQAVALLDGLLPDAGAALRVGISGAPGVGKSTFIEALGLHVVGEGHRVAVLAVDPSSARSRGSVLGDKTRMERLSREPDAYIRPSPSGGSLGGVARRTREAMLVCEAAGFDVIVIETVGVGQSETEVDEMVDLFVLLVGPGAGDELQVMKRGIVEMADLVVVTKADGALLDPAQHAAADFGHALHLHRRKHRELTPRVLLASAATGAGVAEVWAAVVEDHEVLRAAGALARRRAEQAVRWFWSEVQERLILRLRSDPAMHDELDDVERRVANGSLAPPAAAQQVVDRHTGRRDQ